MTEEQFNTQMTRLAGVFGKSHYQNDQRMEMIWQTVKSLEYFDFISVVDSMIGNMRKAPLPIDFAEAIKSKRRYSPEQNNPNLQFCEMCKGLGFLRAMQIDGDVETLVNCTCSVGKLEIWSFPILNTKLRTMFKTECVPAAWFKYDETKKISQESVKPMVDQWKARIRAAEKYWQEWGEILGVEVPASRVVLGPKEDLGW